MFDLLVNYQQCRKLTETKYTQVNILAQAEIPFRSEENKKKKAGLNNLFLLEKLKRDGREIKVPI